MVTSNSRLMDMPTFPDDLVPKLFIIGDAAGQATPWYNKGVRPALEGGEMCGNIIVEAYENGKFRRRTLMKYQHISDTKNRRLYGYARLCAAGYFRSQEQWDDSVRYQATFTPEEMMGVVRYCNFPKVGPKQSSRDSCARRPAEVFREIIFGIFRRTRSAYP